jgi:hypothetical protein
MGKLIMTIAMLMASYSMAMPQTGHSPYASQERREIKSLSPEQIARYGALRGYDPKHGHDTGHRP